MKPLIIAHRGWSGRYPENTLAAIRGAIAWGVDMVEIDVQATGDGELVVFHDYRLDRIYGKRKRVRDARRTELPAAPTLAEVLRACRGKVRLLVEIKGAPGDAVARLIEKFGMSRDVIAFSIKPQRIREVQAAVPQIPVFGLAANRLGLARPGLRVQGWGVSRRLIRTHADVTRFHRRGQQVFVWTVNQPDEIRRLIEWGVDGIISDHPDRVRASRACAFESDR